MYSRLTGDGSAHPRLWLLGVLSVLVLVILGAGCLRRAGPVPSSQGSLDVSQTSAGQAERADLAELGDATTPVAAATGAHGPLRQGRRTAEKIALTTGESP